MDRDALAFGDIADDGVSRNRGAAMSQGYGQGIPGPANLDGALVIDNWLNLLDSFGEIEGRGLLLDLEEIQNRAWGRIFRGASKHNDGHACHGRPIPCGPFDV